MEAGSSGSRQPWLVPHARLQIQAGKGTHVDRVNRLFVAFVFLPRCFEDCPEGLREAAGFLRVDEEPSDFGFRVETCKVPGRFLRKAALFNGVRLRTVQ